MDDGSQAVNWRRRPESHTPDRTGRTDEPWWTRAAITWAESHLTPDMDVIEWGAGSSTVWLASRVRSVVSIEHQREWAAQVSAALIAHGCNRKRYRVICHPLGIEYCQGVPGRYDVAIIDGRRRVQCCRSAAALVKPGGLLVLDNAERERYAEVHTLLRAWDVTRTDNGIWRTDIWQRPN